MPNLKKSIFRAEWNSLWVEKKERIVKQILLSKLWYIGQIYTIPKFMKEENKNNNSPTLNSEVWTRYYRHRYWIKLSRISMNLRIIKPHQALWNVLMLYWLNLKNNSNQFLCLFRQKKILRSSTLKNMQKQNNEAFFRKYSTIYRIKCNAANKTQNFQMRPKSFMKSFTWSAGSSLQIN